MQKTNLQSVYLFIQTGNWNVWRILKNGADVYQKTRLPPCMVDIAPSAVKYREANTNTAEQHWASKPLLPFLFIPEKLKI